MYSLSEIEAVMGCKLRRSGRLYFASCPFHEDRNPSFCVDLNKGYYKCFGCGKHGSLSSLPEMLGKCSILTKYNYSLEEVDDSINRWIPEIVVNSYVTTLWEKENLLNMVRSRVPKDEIIKTFKLGYCIERARFTIPIYEDGVCRNIKMVSFTNRIKQLNFAKGFGSPPRLFGRDILSQDRIIICAGEWDCLVLRCFDFPSITGTAGENTWLPSWNQHFEGKKVYIIYDSDAAGISGSRKVAENLIQVAEFVKIVKFSDVENPPVGFDISDYFLKLHKNRDQFISCLKNATNYRNRSFSMYCPFYIKDIKKSEFDIKKSDSV